MPNLAARAALRFLLRIEHVDAGDELAAAVHLLQSLLLTHGEHLFPGHQPARHHVRLGFLVLLPEALGSFLSFHSLSLEDRGVVTGSGVLRRHFIRPVEASTGGIGHHLVVSHRMWSAGGRSRLRASNLWSYTSNVSSILPARPRLGPKSGPAWVPKMRPPARPRSRQSGLDPRSSRRAGTQKGLFVRRLREGSSHSRASGSAWVHFTRDVGALHPTGQRPGPVRPARVDRRARGRRRWPRRRRQISPRPRGSTRRPEVGDARVSRR